MRYMLPRILAGDYLPLPNPVRAVYGLARLIQMRGFKERACSCSLPMHSSAAFAHTQAQMCLADIRLSMLRSDTLARRCRQCARTCCSGC